MRDRNRATQEKQRSQPDTNRKTGTKPTLALSEYAGKYEHAGYGTLTISLEGDALKAAINGISSPLRHYHYDIFESTEGQMERQKVAFQMNQRGEIDRISVSIEPAVAPLVFTRMPEAKPLDKATLEKLTGKYEVQPGVDITVSLRPDGALTLNFPGQPDYELVNQKDLQFISKALPPGFMFEFHTGADGVATEIVVTQPNGVVTFKKK